MSEGGQASRTFADKLNHLFDTVRPRGGRPYSMDQVAEGIAEQSGESVSGGYLWMLRKGRRDNPTIKTVEAIAHFFGVPPAYFLDDDLADKVDEQLELLAKMRDAGLESLGVRAAELSPESRAAIARIIDAALEMVEDTEPPAQDGAKKVKPTSDRGTR